MILSFIDELQEPYSEIKEKMPKQKGKRQSSHSKSTHKVLADLPSTSFKTSKPNASNIQKLEKIFPNIFPDTLEMILKRKGNDLMCTIQEINGLVKDAELLPKRSRSSPLTSTCSFNNPHHYQSHPGKVYLKQD